MKLSKPFNLVLQLILLLSVTSNLTAQLQDVNWYFGNQAGLNFTDSTQEPIAITDGMMNTDGGSASISDENGNLLIYSNGINVWGADHKTIANGTGLFGSSNVSQSVLIVPNPTNENEYYIFTNQGEDPGSLGLHYSIISLTEIAGDDDDYEYCNDAKTKVSICHNGKNTLCVSINALQDHLDHGDKLGSCDDDNKEMQYSVTSKNIPLLPYASEKLTAIYNDADNSYWVVSFAPKADPTHNDTFYAFKVDANGVSLVKESTFDFLIKNEEHTGGQMKISSDLQNLGLVHNTKEIERDGGLKGLENVFTFDFDSDTGTVSSKKLHSIIRDPNNTFKLVSSAEGFNNVHSLLSDQTGSNHVVASAYGFEFSPEGDKFYISTKEKIEYDTNNIASFINIFQVLYKNSPNSSANNSPVYEIGYGYNSQVYSLQLGIDGKIYATDNTGNLDQICNPDGLGTGCVYKKDGISLNGKLATKGLPQLNQVYQKAADRGSATNKKSIIKGNPFRNELIIDLDRIRSVKFYNEQGAMVKLVVYNDSVDRSVYNIDTSELTVGIYFLVVEDDQSQFYNETVFKTD